MQNDELRGGFESNERELFNLFVDWNELFWILTKFIIISSGNVKPESKQLSTENKIYLILIDHNETNKMIGRIQLKLVHCMFILTMIFHYISKIHFYSEFRIVPIEFRIGATANTECKSKFNISTNDDVKGLCDLCILIIAYHDVKILLINKINFIIVSICKPEKGKYTKHMREILAKHWNFRFSYWNLPLYVTLWISESFPKRL